MPRLQALLDRFLIAHVDVPGVLLHLSGDRHRWSGSAGVRDVVTAEPLIPDATYRIASITKSFVAAAVLRLEELGKLDVDDPLGVHLDAGLLRDILGEQRCEQIRLRHLLTHTSGLSDFVMDTDYDTRIFATPHRRWSREDQVRLALTHDDVADPGVEFHYSDTGYVVLGAVIERTTGVGFAESLRTLLRFDALGMSSTYMETLEPVPQGAQERAHQYTGGVDTYEMDPSFDLWGGGGLVSTAADVAAFYRALFRHHVYDNPETLTRMLQTVAEHDGASTAMGIARREIGGHPLWGHGGYWGLYAGSVPTLDLALSVAVLERDALAAVATELLPAAVETYQDAMDE